jgi:sugar phosphate permease
MEFVRAYSANFRKDLSLTGFGADLQRWIVRVGRVGFAARGVVFGLIGVFLIQAARHNDAGEAVGLGGALQKLADQSQGQILLGVVAAGLAMYGLFSIVEARYRWLTR